MNREDNELDKAAETVAEGEMPPLRYTINHKEALISPSEREELIRGLRRSLPEEREG